MKSGPSSLNAAADFGEHVCVIEMIRLGGRGRLLVARVVNLPQAHRFKEARRSEETFQIGVEHHVRVAAARKHCGKRVVHAPGHVDLHEVANGAEETARRARQDRELREP